MVETRLGDVGRLAWLPSRQVGSWVVLLLWLVAAAVSVEAAGKLTGAQENDNASWLPTGAESTEVLDRGKPGAVLGEEARSKVLG